jgi:hypothetical protein
LHGLHAVEGEFAEPVVRRLVSFEVLQRMVLDVRPESPGISFRTGAWVFFQYLLNSSLLRPALLNNTVTYLIIVVSSFPIHVP